MTAENQKKDRHMAGILKPSVAGILLLAASTSAGLAQDWRGAEIILGYSALFDDTDVDKFTLKGSGETMIGESFSLQGDVTLSRGGDDNEDVNNVTLHGIYNFAAPNALGVFVGRDDLDGTSGTLYGIEGNHGDRSLQFQWHVGQWDGDDADATLAGLDLWFEVAPDWLLGAHYDQFSFDDQDIDLQNLSVSVRYDFTEEASFFAQYGGNEVDTDNGSDSEPYFALGVRFNFGARGGTTMGYRGIENVVLAN